MLPLYLCNIQIRYFYPIIMLRYVLLYLLISRLALHSCQIHLIHIKFHIHMMFRFMEFGQKTDPLHMPRGNATGPIYMRFPQPLFDSNNLLILKHLSNSRNGNKAAIFRTREHIKLLLYSSNMPLFAIISTDFIASS